MEVLGQHYKIGKQAIEEFKDAKTIAMAQEYALLEKRQKGIKELLNSLILAIEQGYGQMLKEVV